MNESQLKLKSSFISKTAVKIVIFVFIMSIILFIAQSASPIVSNSLAIGQMQNSDEAFVVMNTYNKVRPMFSMAMIGICILFAISIVKDTIKFVKNIKDVEKEN